MVYIAVCDDNKQDLFNLMSILREILDRLAISYSIKLYESGEKLLELSSVFNLIFLNVTINKKNGIEIGKNIFRKNSSVKIIYQSEYIDFNIEAINQTHAFAFIEKPVKKWIIEEQIEDFIKCYEINQNLEAVFKNVSYFINEKDIIYPILDILVNEIIYFQYIKTTRKICIITKENNYIFSDSMKNLEKRMLPLGFEISCRGFLVNLSKIKQVKGHSVFLDNGIKVPLSQRRILHFRNRINENNV